jgi:hypothetical protein
VSTLDLLGPGLTLFTGPGNLAWAEAAAAGAGALPLDVRELSTLTARAMGIRGGGALLARPDGTPAGWWPHAAGAATALRVAIGAALSGANAPERDAA